MQGRGIIDDNAADGKEGKLFVKMSMIQYTRYFTLFHYITGYIWHFCDIFHNICQIIKKLGNNVIISRKEAAMPIDMKAGDKTAAASGLSAGTVSCRQNLNGGIPAVKEAEKESGSGFVNRLTNIVSHIFIFKGNPTGRHIGISSGFP